MDRKCTKCKEFYPDKMNNYDITLLKADNGIMITEICPLCGEDIRFAIIRNNNFLNVED